MIVGFAGPSQTVLAIDEVLQIDLRSLTAAGKRHIGGMVLGVPAEMTALAKCATMLRISMAFVMVHVSDR